MKRCSWCNKNNIKYIQYHDQEWGVPSYDDAYLFEMLVLESFQAGLSWEIVLNKREALRKAFLNFNYQAISHYDEKNIAELLLNKDIIRHKQKIISIIQNAKIFMEIQSEWNSFASYIWHFSKNQIIYETDKSKSPLSDLISLDLKKRGMKFVGTTIIYAYLQAIGIINSHEKSCFKFHQS